MATDQLINKTQGDAIIAGLAAIKNAINDQPVPTQVEDVVSDAFDVGVSYVPGDYCIYENKLYKCDVAHHGAWDGNDFTLTNVGAELDTLNNALNNIYPFKSLTKVLDTSSYSDISSQSYTANVDCKVLIRLNWNSNRTSEGTIKVNNVIQDYFGYSTNMGILSKTLRLALKANDKITFTNTAVSGQTNGCFLVIWVETI